LRNDPSQTKLDPNWVKWDYTSTWSTATHRRDARAQVVLATPDHVHLVPAVGVKGIALVYSHGSEEAIDTEI
jgi:hypothetical protein